MEKTIQQIVNDRDAAARALKSVQELQTALAVKPEIMTAIRDALYADALETRDELMLGTEDNLRCDPDDRYDQGYHDALLDVLVALGESRPEYGEHFN